MLIAVLFGGGAMYWAAEIRDRDTLDARLEHLSTALRLFIEHEIEEGEMPRAEDMGPLKAQPTASSLYRFQAWTRHGYLILHSHDASATVPIVDLTQAGYGSITIDDEEYRVLSTVTNEGEVIIQVAECVDERETRLGMITINYVAFLLPPFGLALGASGLMLRRSFRPVHALAEDLRNRSPLDATRPRVTEPPQELQPVLKSLDSLLDRFGHALAAERRFTAVAAHELRTPLAGIRAQAQLASTSTDSGESAEALAAVMSGVDRAARVLDQLLDLARVDAVSKEVASISRLVDLSATFQELMHDLEPMARARRIVLSASFVAGHIYGLKFPIYTLLRNLINNAIQYSPEGGRVEVATAWHGAEVMLTVDDTGPGIPAAARERAFDRFDRLGNSGADGAGLGLSIVAQVVELHQAKIQLLDSPLGGLRVQVLFRANGTASTA